MFLRCFHLALLLCLAACQNKTQTQVQAPPADDQPPQHEVQTGPAPEVKLTSGLGVGEAVGAFQVVKAGGVADDVPVDKELCYR
jgi:hypothetical protein